ncbi:TetR/AcrR family transcriptional regulator [Algoriphagus terrigena]|uniref:TetR/AcrR family transcriptional regulator n=1 Tax=Algoriphagus terrigena TaxID=344884 RepID=UPI0004077FF7|nr:TetR/AcrR family transcriptional regulator [Algoriphagus terrigena]
MGSKDRILRLKEETRSNILTAAFEIVKEEGWKGLSMRKIADRIEYTAPIIYEYFDNKDAILNELTKMGFEALDKVLEKEQAKHAEPEKQLYDMWLAYWDFALNNREIYQVMFGVEMTCCIAMVGEAQLPSKRFCPVIDQLMSGYEHTMEDCKQKYFTFFSVIHGLVSINIVGDGLSTKMNNQILNDAIGGIIKAIQQG